MKLYRQACPNQWFNIGIFSSEALIIEAILNLVKMNIIHSLIVDNWNDAGIKQYTDLFNKVQGISTISELAEFIGTNRGRLDSLDTIWYHINKESLEIVEVELNEPNYKYVGYGRKKFHKNLIENIPSGLLTAEGLKLIKNNLNEDEK
jgi:hypothetical protein